MGYIEFKNITRFCSPTQKACDDITFNIEKGHVHALVGENGAGKSTLMKILGGLVPADTGEMKLRGQNYQPETAKDAFQNRIGFVHQHFLLADHLTVMDHLILNWPGTKLLSINSTKAILAKLEEFKKKFNWTFQLNKTISELSVGEQQRIEIVKALMTDPDIIIFDEPTAVLAPQEIEDFLRFIKQLKAEGKTIILISHKLDEVKEVSDRLTVLRHGKSILTDSTAQLSTQDIAESMIGQKLNAGLASAASTSTDVLFELKDLSLSLRRKQILGVAGIEGNGQSRLIEKLLGAAKDKKITYADIPEDRLRLGLFQGLNLVDHMILRHSENLSRGGFIQKKKAEQVTEEIVQKWDVRPHNIFLEAERLSGGNQQKFVIGRELYHNPDFILAAHPSRGVDLGAQEKIHAALIEKKDQNKSIVLVSSDLDEVLKLSDQYYILYHHALYGPFLKSQLREIEIGQFMTGSHPSQKQFERGKLEDALS